MARKGNALLPATSPIENFMHRSIVAKLIPYLVDSGFRYSLAQAADITRRFVSEYLMPVDYTRRIGEHMTTTVFATSYPQAYNRLGAAPYAPQPDAGRVETQDSFTIGMPAIDFSSSRYMMGRTGQDLIYIRKASCSNCPNVRWSYYLQ